MSRIAPMRPPHQKPEKIPRNPDYMDRVRELPCIICQEWGLPQNSFTTAHHPIHGRYGNRKVPDVMCIPLCDGHHQGTFDTSKVAVHREPDRRKRLYGEDHEFTARVQDMLGFDGTPVKPE